jgi:predicted enzyme related to lactoylglutathione lyase
MAHGSFSHIEATRQRIGAAGGKKIVPKTRIPSRFGPFALLFDSVGHRLGLWSGN